MIYNNCGFSHLFTHTKKELSMPAYGYTGQSLSSGFNLKESSDSETPHLAFSPSQAQSQVGAPFMNLHQFDQPTDTLSLREGELLFKEGDVPKGLYMVKSGAVKIVVNRPNARGRVSSPEFVVKIVGPGEFFGFKALVQGNNHGFLAKTIRPSEIQIFSKDAVTQALSGVNSVFRKLIIQTMQDLEHFEQTTQLHYLASVQERISHQILVLAERFGVMTPNGISLNLKLTRNELAQLAGTINESLSRHLTDLKNDGVIDLNGKEIIIKDKAALLARSGNEQKA